MEIERKIYKQLVEITQRANPNEASAFLFDNNRIVIEANPLEKSIAHFSDIDPVWVAELITKHGKPTALFHSHPCSAYPSFTDFRFMITTIGFWGCIWLIMSSTHNLRAWSLDMNKQIDGVDNINYMKFLEIEVEFI